MSDERMPETTLSRRLPPLGQHPAPVRLVAHLSDPHLLGANAPLYGAVDTESWLRRALEQLERSELAPSAIVFTGDLTDLGEPDAYERLRAAVVPAAERMGAEVVWVMGNHDERPAYAHALFGGEAGDRPQDRVHDIDGLRIVALDSTVPGYHHGAFDPEQLEWLRSVLAEPAEHGTLLALHHPPLPTLVELMAVLELRDQHLFADVVRGTDVRGILAGHMHHAQHGLFAGVPVSVAAATCYTIDASAPPRTLTGRDGGRTMNLVAVYDDQVVHTIVPVGDASVVSGFDPSFVERFVSLSPEERLERFSRKRSPEALED